MNWKKVKLGEICEFLSGFAWSAKNFKESGKMPIIRIQNMCSDKPDDFIYWDEKYDEKFIIKKNDLLLSLSGSIKIDYWKGVDALLNQRIVKITSNSSVNDRWFFWQMQSGLKRIEKMGKWALVNNVSITDLKNLEIPLPDLATQKHIAEVLDKADALRQQNRQLLAHYDELLQSTFIELFGDPVKNPKGWEVKKLGEVVENKNNLRIPVKDADRKEMQGEYPYYGATGVIDSVNDYKFDGEYLLIAEDGKNLLFRKKPNAFMAYGKFWVNNHAHIMKYNGKANLRFLEFCFNKIDLKPYVTGIDQFKLTRNTLDIIPITVPPLPLQQHFAKIVEQIEAQKAQTQAALAESEALFEGLLAGYFNA